MPWIFLKVLGRFVRSIQVLDIKPNLAVLSSHSSLLSLGDSWEPLCSFCCSCFCSQSTYAMFCNRYRQTSSDILWELYTSLTRNKNWSHSEKLTRFLWCSCGQSNTKSRIQRCSTKRNVASQPWTISFKNISILKYLQFLEMKDKLLVHLLNAPNSY